MQVCAAVDPGLELTWTQMDGDFVVKGTIFGSVHGAARSILVAERVALNFLQRMSGIATAAHTMVAAVEVRMHLVSQQGGAPLHLVIVGRIFWALPWKSAMMRPIA